MNVMTFLWQVEFDVGEILLWQEITQKPHRCRKKTTRLSLD